MLFRSVLPLKKSHFGIQCKQKRKFDNKIIDCKSNKKTVYTAFKGTKIFIFFYDVQVQTSQRQGGREPIASLPPLMYYFFQLACSTPFANTSWKPLTFAAISPPNTAEPATITSAPAATISAVLESFAPPSISSSHE